MTPNLTFPNTFLTVVNALWHGYCYVHLLTHFNARPLALARFL